MAHCQPASAASSVGLGRGSEPLSAGASTPLAAARETPAAAPRPRAAARREVCQPLLLVLVTFVTWFSVEHVGSVVALILFNFVIIMVVIVICVCCVCI